MRPGPGEHHRMPTLDQGEVRVVPPAAQVVTGLVMRGEHHPPRGRQPGVVERAGAVEEDRDLLPVRLMLIDPTEPRAPVVERVEEPVLADHPVTIAHHPAVVRRPIRLQVLLLQQERLRRATAGHAATEDQRQPVQRIDQPTQQAHRRQPAGPPQPRRPVLERDPHLGRLGPGHDARQRRRLARDRLLHPAQHPRVEGLRRRLDHRLPARQLRPQRRMLHIVVHRHREEVLTPGEPHHRLKSPQQREIVRRGARGVVGHGPHRRGIWPGPAAGLPLGHRRPLVAPSRSARGGTEGPAQSGRPTQVRAEVRTSSGSAC